MSKPRDQITDAIIAMLVASGLDPHDPEVVEVLRGLVESDAGQEEFNRAMNDLRTRKVRS